MAVMDMVSNANAEEQDSGLNHVYFFIDKTTSTKNENGHSDNNSTTETSNGSLQHHSRASSPGSNKAESFTSLTTASSSEMNPLAPVFKPRSEDQGATVVPPAPSATQMFELRKTSDKGFGLFATAHIKRGTLIICEEPLLKIPGRDVHLAWGPYCRLGNAQRAAYDSLYAFNPANINLEHASRALLIDPNDDSLDQEDVEELVAEQVRIMSIFSVNNIEMQTGGLAVFATASRLNHSCTPNVHHSYNPPLKSMTVHAVRDIYPEEELLTTYLGGPGTYIVRSERNEKLIATYGFTCSCHACSDDTGQSDGRRELMACVTWGLDQYNQAAAADHPFVPANPLAALRQAEDLITIMLSEGVVTIELTKAYRTASTRALKLKDYDKAIEYSRNEAEVERNCLGTQLGDLRKLGVASELWFDEIIRVIRKEEGDGLADKYRSLARAEKKKKQKKVWVKKKKSGSRTGSNGAVGGTEDGVAST